MKHQPGLRVARRGTSRQINRRIALDLIRTRQPISRADLARLMGTGRGAVTVLVNDLIAEGRVSEGATGEAPRGRKPKFLYLDSRRRCVAAVDLRPTRWSLMLTDIMGEPLVGVTSFPTERDPARCVRDIAARVRETLARHAELGRCEGIGVVVPGMVDHTGTRVAATGPDSTTSLSIPSTNWSRSTSRSRLLPFVEKARSRKTRWMYRAAPRFPTLSRVPT